MLFVALGVVVFATVSCSSPGQPTFPERAFDTAWVMDASAVEHLRASVNAVNLGDGVERVVKTVGVPDSDHMVQKNEKNRIFTYYVTRQRADSPIESDKVAKIAFDGRDKVKAIFSNVEGIASRNWP